jgi:VanZ family protein
LKEKLKQWLWRWGPACVMMALIFIASSQTKAQLPQFGAWDLLVKKSGHVLGYALLAVAYLHALANGRPVTARWLLLAVGCACLYAVTDEFHQRFVSGRTASPVDVLIDTGGSSLGVALRALIRIPARPSRLRPPSILP